MTFAAIGSLLLAGCGGAAEVADADVPSPSQAPLPPMTDAGELAGMVGLVDPEWADVVADVTGIPRQALLAYAGAAIRASETFPECGIGWNTIAAIGLTESDHGRHGGAAVGEDFRAVPEIFGAALDGTDYEAIPDTDGGAIDGDTEHDRAVGPMQLLPETWASWPSDGNGDGVPDIHNIADASIAAAHHLCRSSGYDMVDADGWTAGVAGYNSATGYRADIARAAASYADEAAAATD